MNIKTDETTDFNVKMPNHVSVELEAARAHKQRELEHVQDCKQLWMNAYCATLAGGIITNDCNNSYSKSAEFQANQAVKNFKANFR